MKKIVILMIVTILSILTLTGCGSKADTTTETPATETKATETKATENSDKVLSGKHLKVAMSANYKYFETVTVDANGKEVYEGLDIDILNKMSEDLGFTYEIINMPFASLIGSLQANQADFVISGLSYTDERAESVDFTDKYATAKVGVITKTDSGIDSVEDLAGKKVASSAGTDFEQIIKNIKGTELVTFDGQALVTQELMMGRVDAAVTGGSAVKKIAEENDGLSYFIMDSNDATLGAMSTYNIAFPKGSELVKTFNEEIAKLDADGTLDEIITNWLGADYVD